MEKKLKNRSTRKGVKRMRAFVNTRIPELAKFKSYPPVTGTVYEKTRVRVNIPTNVVKAKTDN